MHADNLKDTLELYGQLQKKLHQGQQSNAPFKQVANHLFGYQPTFITVETIQAVSLDELKGAILNEVCSGWLALQDTNKLVYQQTFTDALEGPPLQGELCSEHSTWRFTRTSDNQYQLTITRQVDGKQPQSIACLAKPIKLNERHGHTLQYHKYYRINASGALRPFHAQLLQVRQSQQGGEHE
tara:strand:- start:2345 stop:2893 length:549 start_codon:yes stop_codon:yes gene_type:complete